MKINQLLTLAFTIISTMSLASGKENVSFDPFKKWSEWKTDTVSAPDGSLEIVQKRHKNKVTPDREMVVQKKIKNYDTCHNLIRKRKVVEYHGSNGPHVTKYDRKYHSGCISSYAERFKDE